MSPHMVSGMTPHVYLHSSLDLWELCVASGLLCCKSLCERKRNILRYWWQIAHTWSSDTEWRDGCLVLCCSTTDVQPAVFPSANPSWDDEVGSMWDELCSTTCCKCVAVEADFWLRSGRTTVGRLGEKGEGWKARGWGIRIISPLCMHGEVKGRLYLVASRSWSHGLEVSVLRSPRQDDACSRSSSIPLTRLLRVVICRSTSAENRV